MAVGGVNNSELDNFTGQMLRDAGFAESQQAFTAWIWGRGLAKAEVNRIKGPTRGHHTHSFAEL